MSESIIERTAGNKAMKTMITLLAVFGITDTGLAQAHEEMIEARQNAFSNIENQTKVVSKQVKKSDIDWQAMLAASEQLMVDSNMLSHAFEAGSLEGSKAKESVWSKPEKFNRLLAEMQQGYKQVAEGVDKQSIDEVKRGLKVAESTCKSCHRSYRSRW
ncbi:c-type cytochrome [Vibrio maritimus]|uniref:c-type cytochrome n=1 Tax=Vibrio maritimus TaxID=990268 RepID=UPI004069649D